MDQSPLRQGRGRLFYVFKHKTHFSCKICCTNLYWHNIVSEYEPAFPFNFLMASTSITYFSRLPKMLFPLKVLDFVDKHTAKKSY